MNHKGSVRLETERVILRPFEEGDATGIYRNWASDDEVTKFLSWPSHSSLKVTQGLLVSWITRYADPENYDWAICFKEGNIVIGSISMMLIDNNIGSCEVGYCLGRPWWNKGIMTEAFLEIIRFAFEQVGFERITARHVVANEASGHVIRKCGLQYEGTLRKTFKTNRGETVDCKYYSILKEEYPGTHA